MAHVSSLASLFLAFSRSDLRAVSPKRASTLPPQIYFESRRWAPAMTSVFARQTGISLMAVDDASADVKSKKSGKSDRKKVKLSPREKKRERKRKENEEAKRKKKVNATATTSAFLKLDKAWPLQTNCTEQGSQRSKQLTRSRAQAIASIANKSFIEGDSIAGRRACRLLIEMAPIVNELGLTTEELGIPWAQIFRAAGKWEKQWREGKSNIPDRRGLPCNLGYSVLNAMASFPPHNDDETYEVLSNTLVRREVFVAGAVDMTGCPPDDRGEAAFFGRSNVGKSSLINMITNRKRLAYTSQTPGKTQQFNFFAINDKPKKEREIRFGDIVAGEKDPDSMYLVDLPGFGYAKVPEKMRREWADFFKQYVQERTNLKTLFHLIDSRTGLIDEDRRVMRQVGEDLPKHVKYVAVLTKADKGNVSEDVLNSVKRALQANMPLSVPIVVTSAETRRGRDEMWRYLRYAAEARTDS